MTKCLQKMITTWCRSISWAVEFFARTGWKVLQRIGNTAQQCQFTLFLVSVLDVIRRQFLDADPDPYRDPLKWCRSDRIRIYNTASLSVLVPHVNKNYICAFFNKKKTVRPDETNVKMFLFIRHTQTYRKYF
jgi:hypothetical protein